jgi:hypothetical protein
MLSIEPRARRSAPLPARSAALFLFALRERSAVFLQNARERSATSLRNTRERSATYGILMPMKRAPPRYSCPPTQNHSPGLALTSTRGRKLFPVGDWMLAEIR